MAYVTLARPARAEIVIKKSRFLAHAAPVKSEAEAWAFIERVRSEHKEAAHNVFAFRAGPASRLSDDGEPGGTAGRPVFDVLERQSVADAVIVVTRYFGGILLGAGGLVRAYSQAAAAVVEEAGLARGAAAVDQQLQLEYASVNRVQYLLQQRGGIILRSDFGREVTLVCRLLAEAAPWFEAELAEASAGRIRVERLGELQVGADLHAL